MKSIQVSKDVWKQLCEIKQQKKFKHMNQVVKWLVEQVFFPDEKTSVSRSVGDTETISTAGRSGDSDSSSEKVRSHRLREKINSKQKNPLSHSSGSDFILRPRTPLFNIKRDYKQSRFFLGEKTNDCIHNGPSQVTCRWCGTINIVDSIASNGYIRCCNCGSNIRV